MLQLWRLCVAVPTFPPLVPPAHCGISQYTVEKLLLTKLLSTSMLFHLLYDGFTLQSMIVATAHPMSSHFQQNK
ncbi:hypothetical protein CPB86DRAFT_155787 [Serendipita vermifera]|nr:hypothetical protein CPB86DRAFT_155787 [Serendipita vermifera]